MFYETHLNSLPASQPGKGRHSPPSSGQYVPGGHDGHVHHVWPRQAIDVSCIVAFNRERPASFSYSALRRRIAAHSHQTYRRAATRLAAKLAVRLRAALGAAVDRRTVCRRQRGSRALSVDPAPEDPFAWLAHTRFTNTRIDGLVVTMPILALARARLWASGAAGRAPLRQGTPAAPGDLSARATFQVCSAVLCIQIGAGEYGLEVDLIVADLVHRVWEMICSANLHGAFSERGKQSGRPQSVSVVQGECATSVRNIDQLNWFGAGVTGCDDDDATTGDTVAAGGPIPVFEYYTFVDVRRRCWARAPPHAVLTVSRRGAGASVCATLCSQHCHPVVR